MLSRRAAPIALLLATIVLSACSADQQADTTTDNGPTTTTSATTTTTTPAATTTSVAMPPSSVASADTGGESIAERCLGDVLAEADVTEVTFTTGDGIELFGAELGSGPNGVVLLHGTSSAALCNWAEVSVAMADDDIHVLAIDHRCQGFSGCGENGRSGLEHDALAAVAALRERGATSVTLVGESRGGAVALGAAAMADDETGPDGVAALSAVELPGIFSDETAELSSLVAEIDVPVLYMSSLDDSSVDQEDHEGWISDTVNATSVVYEDRGHGARMLRSDTMDAPYTDDLLPFLQDRS